MAKKRTVDRPVDPSDWPVVVGTVQEMDCIEGMKKLPDGCADLVFADPPFNLGRNYADCDDNLELYDYLEWSCRWLDQAIRILKPAGSLFVCSSEEHVCELKLLTEGSIGLTIASGDEPQMVCREHLQAMKPRHHIIWYYTFGVNSPKKLTRSHTHILHFVKSVKKHKWHDNEVRVPSARQLVYNDKRANPDGRLPDDVWILRPQDARAGFLPDHDVQHESRVCGTYNERCQVDNQMPEQLIGRIVRWCTDPGDLVVSPFCGSGTDAVVAKKLGRKFVTYDVSGAYIQQALVRLSAAKEGDMLDRPEPDKKPKGKKSRGQQT